MSRTSLRYVCQSCGQVTSKWAGRCGACGEWNSIAEEPGEPISVAGQKRSSRQHSPVKLESLQGDIQNIDRISSGYQEINLVTGGGLVPGSAVLIGGHPGIGKSTLLTQIAGQVARQGKRVLYFSGEEASAQVRLRAQRLQMADTPVELGAETNLEAIQASIAEGSPPQLVIVDSIQTLWSETVESAPGTVTQLRASTHALIRMAKKRGFVLLIVGHVTKDGAIAGPKVIEHMVDTVLYFEGERGQQFRILRAYKNRFGASDEIGVFEMQDVGLIEVANPSELFLNDRETDSPGLAVFAGIEGTRPVLVEIQALVSSSPFGTPRRAVVGWDNNRLSMILAVIETRCGLVLGGHDVFLNIAGGLKINEPAADVAVASALLSSFTNKQVPKESIFFGEISLSGAIRPVSCSKQRLREATKLGFLNAYIPGKTTLDQEKQITCHPLNHINDLMDLLV